MPRVDFPNGDSIDFPDETPVDVINQKSSEYWTRAAAGTPPAAPMSTETGQVDAESPAGRFLRDATPRPMKGPALPLGAAAVRGVARGAGELIGSFPDVAGAIVNQALLAPAETIYNAVAERNRDFGRFNFGGTTDALANAAADSYEGLTGAPWIPTADLAKAGMMPPASRFAYEVGRILPQTAAVSGGSRAMAVAKTARGEVPGAYLAPYAERPVATIAADTGAGLGAAAGSTAAQSVAPDSPTAQIAGEFLGSLGGATATNAMRAVPGGVVKAVTGQMADPNVPVDPATGTGTSRRVANIAADQMQRGATDLDAARSTLAESNAAYTAAGVPEAGRPTAGSRSQDPGLIAMERGERMSRAPSTFKRGVVPDDPANAAAFIARDKTVVEDARGRLDSLTPPDTVKGDLRAKDEAATIATERIAPAASRVDAAEGAVRQAQDAVSQGTADTAAGVAAREQAVGAAKQAEADALGAVKGRYDNQQDAASKALDKAVVDDTLRPMQEQRSANYAAIDPNGEVPMDNARLRASVQRIRDEVPSTIPAEQALPNDLLNQLDSITGPDAPPVTFRDMQALRGEITSREQAARQAKNYTLADNLKKLRRVVEDQTDALGRGGDEAGGEAAVRAQDALRYDAEQFGPRFRQGEGDRLRKDINRAPQGADGMLDRKDTPPTATASRFLFKGPGGEEAARSLTTILRGQPSEAAGLDAARTYVMADLARTLKGDKADPAALRAWIGDRKGMLDQVPALRAEVDQTLRNVVNGRAATTRLEAELKQYAADRAQHMADLEKKATGAGAAADAAKKELAAIQRQIDDSALSILIKNDDPQQAVAQVFARSGRQAQAMEEVVGKIGRNPDALRAWKRNVTDYLLDKVTQNDANNSLSLAQMNKTFDDHRAALSAVYSGAELNALQTVHKQIRDLARKNQQSVAGSGTAENLQDILRQFEVGAKLYAGQLAGGGIVRSVKLAIPYIPGLNDYEKARLLIRRAYFDGELAQHLLTMPVDRAPPVGWRKGLAAMLAGTETARESVAAEPSGAGAPDVRGAEDTQRVDGGPREDMLRDNISPDGVTRHRMTKAPKDPDLDNQYIRLRGLSAGDKVTIANGEFTVESVDADGMVAAKDKWGRTARFPARFVRKDGL